MGKLLNGISLFVEKSGFFAIFLVVLLICDIDEEKKIVPFGEIEEFDS